MTTLRITQDPEADALLSSDPLALIVGMLLDQQFPMERAFSGPHLLAQRLGHTPDAHELAEMDPEQLAAIFATPPAIHRYPGSMAGRVQELCRAVVADYAGDVAAIWTTAATGAELLARLRALPGFGEQKAKIFTALLGKQCGVKPKGWTEAAAPYSEKGSRRSVADITSAKSLAEVRAFKQEMKAAAKAPKA